MAHEDSNTSPEEKAAGLVRTRSGRLVPAGQAILHAPAKAPANVHSKWTLIGVMGGLGILLLGLAVLIANRNERAAGANGSISSILEDVGFVITSTKGIGIER